MTFSPAAMRDFKQVVRTQGDDLRPCARRFLAFVFDHPFDVAFGTLTAIAKKSGVSPNTVIDTLRYFGYSDFRAFREVFRHEVRLKSLSHTS